MLNKVLSALPGQAVSSTARVYVMLLPAFRLLNTPTTVSTGWFPAIAPEESTRSAGPSTTKDSSAEAEGTVERNSASSASRAAARRLEKIQAQKIPRCT